MPDHISSSEGWFQPLLAAGFNTGDAVRIQNKGQGALLVVEAAAAPADDDFSGAYLLPFKTLIVDAGSEAIWMRGPVYGAHVNVRKG